ncbi:FkbM family methyltransferase [Dyadobacter sp. CY323]|uniref:FkbM family methyltransferase n=1 Tax=Dyadobacter sp. CY323 TaxID=2907302 RepID=UPI001F2390B4|nr:FkbM family methyltransferase [Dyadobacter sp. CY323]MCE6992725.1 FkbM family methyltransferase [Dyadobacter sp. CY323]
MIQFLKDKSWGILNTMGFGGSIQLFLESALKQYGWFKTFTSGQSIDAAGNPIPWYTYSFIFFLEPRLKPHFKVFEYGSGNSTRWYGARVNDITAVEHDKDWIEKISQKLPKNAKMLSRTLDETYIQAINTDEILYNIVVVDGRKRVKCASYAVDFLMPDGVLILDNSEREWYQPAKDLLEARGFKRLDFKGMGPIISYEFCSSVFYRENNCLGI